MADNFAHVRGSMLIAHASGRLRTLARRVLEDEGYRVEETGDSAEPLASPRTGLPDVVLLEWTDLPAVRRLLERIDKRNGSRGCGIVVLAKGNQMQDAVRSLTLGADDCIRVPFDSAELMARITACLRRRFGTPEEHLVAGPIFLDKSAHRLLVDDKPLSLAPTEFRLMQFFLENPGRVFSRDELLRGAWTRNANAGPRTVDVHVRRLRQRLEPFDCDRMIQTVRSFGYRFSTESASLKRPTRAVGVAQTRRDH